MICLHGGAAHGMILAAKFAPLFLRVVNNTDGWDVLDAPDDAPVDGDTLSVYIRRTSVGHIHLDGTDLHAWIARANYVNWNEAVDQATLKDNTKWHIWVQQQIGQK